MRQNSNYLSVIGLALGAFFGMIGSFLTNPQVQIGFYEISSVGLTWAGVLLGIRFLQEKEELISAGFFLLAIGEAVMSSGTTLGEVGGQAAFGAGIAIYVPSFLLISVPKRFPLLVRITGILASIPFLIASVKIFMGEEVYSSSGVTGAGYGLFVLTIIGWIFYILKTNQKEPEIEKQESSAKLKFESEAIHS